MHEYYRIHPSRVLLAITLCGHAVIGLAVAVYVDFLPITLAAVSLIALLAWREAGRMLRQGTASLMLDASRASIALEQGGQPYFYVKYKVYATRWFAILKLIDKRKTRTLILHPERFDSIQSYRQLRFALTRLEQSNAA